MEKKIIHIFLSSSDEDTHDLRMELGNYVRALNDRFGERLYFRLEMNGESEGDSYRIAENDYVYTLFFRRAEEDTVRDFHAAYDGFKANGAPKIMTFFKTIPEGEAGEDSVKTFMRELGDKLEHYYTKFENIDTVLLKILFELAGAEDNPIGNVSFQDSKLYINDQEFSTIHLENLPFYGNHEAIHALKEKLEELETEITTARKASRENPDDDDLMDRYADLRNQRARMQIQLHEYEKQLLEVSMSMAKRATDGKPITHRTRLAMEYFDEGKVTEALAVLDQEEFKLDLKRLNEMDEVLTDRYEALVRELMTKIDILKSRGITSESEKEIKDLYEIAWGVIWKEELERDCILDYLAFLSEQKDYDHGIEVGEKLRSRYMSDLEEPNKAQWARCCNLLAGLYAKNNDLDKAEELLQDALNIRIKLAEVNAEVYRPVLAETHYNIAALMCSEGYSPQKRSDMYNNAEYHCLQALDIYLKLVDEGKTEYIIDVAQTYHNISALYYKNGMIEKAKESLEASYEILTTLQNQLTDQESIEIVEAEYASVCADLAFFIHGSEDIGKASLLASESINIYKRLADKNPNKYEEDMARTIKCFADFILDCIKSKKIVQPLVCKVAETFYVGAAKVYAKMAKRNPTTYNSEVATIQEKLGSMYLFSTKRDKAEEPLLFALSIYRELSKKSFEIYATKVGEISNQLGWLYISSARYDDAERMYNESLTACKKLVELNESMYSPNLAIAYNSLGILYEKLDDTIRAESMYIKAYEIRQKLAMINPEDYVAGAAMCCLHLMNIYSKSRRSRLKQKYRNEALRLAIPYEDSIPSCKQIVEKLRNNP